MSAPLVGQVHHPYWRVVRPWTGSTRSSQDHGLTHRLYCSSGLPLALFTYVCCTCMHVNQSQTAVMAVQTASGHIISVFGTITKRGWWIWYIWNNLLIPFYSQVPHFFKNLKMDTREHNIQWCFCYERARGQVSLKIVEGKLESMHARLPIMLANHFHKAGSLKLHIDSSGTYNW